MEKFEHETNLSFSFSNENNFYLTNSIPYTKNWKYCFDRNVKFEIWSKRIEIQKRKIQ